jgi:hypothetical protein
MNILKIASRNCSSGLVAIALFSATHAGAQNLAAPVSGLQILDLAGNPIVAGPTAYSANFVASSAFSTVTFTFRHDPGFFALSNVSVVDLTTLSANLLVNGNFMAGAPDSAGGGAPGWTYFIQAGNLFPQYLGYEDGAGNFQDGSTQAYDGIDQTFGSTTGDLYQVSFNLDAQMTGGNYQQTSTNGDVTDTGGNGIDAVVYAGDGLPPTTVPDAASTAMLLVGAVSLLRLIGMRQVKAVR